MIAGRDNATAVSDLPTAHGLAWTVLLQRWGEGAVEPAAGCSTTTVSCRVFSGVGECFLDDHHVRVRVSGGEDPALARAQGVHRLDPLERPVGGHRGFDPALRAQDPRQPAVIALDRPSAPERVLSRKVERPRRSGHCT